MVMGMEKKEMLLVRIINDIQMRLEKQLEFRVYRVLVVVV